MADEQHVLLQQLEKKNDDRASYLKVALCAAKEAGKVISSFIKTQKTVETKGSAVDLVTEFDKNVEKLIRDILLKEFPEHRFIGEESENPKHALSDEPTWIVDPIDGTTNFVHTNSNVAVSIALVINKRSEVGVVYVPMLDELYMAVLGERSYLNENQLEITSPVKELSNALIVTEWGSTRIPEKMSVIWQNMKAVIQKVHGIRSTGSSAINICLVASGRIDMNYEYGTHCWDVAAASLILQEAGGFVADPKGNNFDMMSRQYIAASSRSLIDAVVPLLTHVPFERDDF